MAFDFGARHLGLAVGCARLGKANPLGRLDVYRGQLKQWSALDALLKTWEPTDLVVGLPLSYHGNVQTITRATHHFANVLRKRYHLPVHLQDERLSSIEAKARLFERSGYAGLRKDQVDAWAASIILEDFFSTI